MSVYVYDEERNDSINEQEADRIIEEAEKNGKEWFIDLGDHEDGTSCNFLIVED